MGMEALHLRRRRRQRLLAAGHRRRVRIRPPPLPHHPRRIRTRSPKPQIPPTRRIPIKPRLRRQARHLPANPWPSAAVPRLPRPHAPRDRARHPRPQFEERERLQASIEQSTGDADVRRRICSPWAAEIGGLVAESGIGESEAIVGGERVVLQDGVRGAFSRVGCGGVDDGDRGESPGYDRRNTEGFGEVFCPSSGEVYVAEFGGQVC